MKILIINLGGMGDIIMMSPVLRAIRLKYQDCEISLLCLKRGFEVAKVFKEINKFYLFNNADIKFFDLLEISGTLKDLRNQKFNYLINLRDTSSFGGNLKMSFIVKAIGARVSIGRSLEGKGRFYNKFYEEKKISDKNEVEITLDLLKSLNIENTPKYISYPVSEKDEKKVSDLFIKGDESKLKIALNPGAFRPSRMWPIELWRALVKLVDERYPKSKIFITGSAGELYLANSIKVLDNVSVTNGKLNIGELAALYKRMDIVISNDSGPMHLAAAVGTKTVCIFGPGDYNRFAPSVDKSKYRIVRKEIKECKVPCYKFRCANPICLNSISAQDVMGKIKELIVDE